MALPRSRLLVPALLRPLGEHLATMVQPAPGDTCVDLGAMGGVMPGLLARSGRLCIAVEDPRDPHDELATQHTGNAVLMRARADALPLPDGCAQVATSLFAPLSAGTLRELLRVLDPRRGRLACAVSVELPGVVVGAPLGGVDLPSSLRVTRIRDVARFDGVAHYEAATGAAVGDALHPYAAADGTIRIPVEAEVVRAGP